MTKSSKTLTDNIFLISIEFNTISGNLALQILDHLLQFSILKDFFHQTLINSNNIFEQNYRFFNHDEFKNDLKEIPWDNILSSDDTSVSLAFDLFLTRVNILLDDHASNRKLSKKEISLKASYHIQALMKEHCRLFKSYFNENNPSIKVAKHSKHKILEMQLYSKSSNRKKNIIRIIFKNFQKMLKKPGMASNQL